MVSEELERKETTIKKQGLEVRVRRLPDGKYVWSIELSTPTLDPKLIDELVSNVDLRLRRRYLGEDVEVPEPPKIEERGGLTEVKEKFTKTIPLESKNRKLFGRIAVYEDKVVLEPIKPLPVRDGAIGWLIGFLEGKYGREKISFEHDRTNRYFRRIIVSEKPSEEELEDLREKATWSFIRATIRPTRRNRPYKRRVLRRWRQGR